LLKRQNRLLTDSLNSNVWDSGHNIVADLTTVFPLFKAGLIRVIKDRVKAVDDHPVESQACWHLNLEQFPLLVINSYLLFCTHALDVCQAFRARNRTNGQGIVQVVNSFQCCVLELKISVLSVLYRIVAALSEVDIYGNRYAVGILGCLVLSNLERKQKVECWIRVRSYVCIFQHRFRVVWHNICNVNFYWSRLGKGDLFFAATGRSSNIAYLKVAACRTAETLRG